MRIKENYLVCVDAEFVDGIGVLEKPEGEFGGDGYVELKNTRPVVLETRTAYSEAEALEQTALDWHLSAEVLTAYLLAPPRPPLEDAILKEFEVLLECDSVSEENKKYLKENAERLAEEISDGWDLFTDDVTERLNLVIEGDE